MFQLSGFTIGFREFRVQVERQGVGVQGLGCRFGFPLAMSFWALAVLRVSGARRPWLAEDTRAGFEFGGFLVVESFGLRLVG